MAGITGIGGAGNGIVVQTGNGVEPDAAAPARNADKQASLAAAAARADKPAREAEVQQSAAKVQQMLTQAAPNLTFAIDKDSGRTVIRVIDPTSHDVLRQIPSEEILRLDKNIDQMISRLKGLLIDRES